MSRRRHGREQTLLHPLPADQEEKPRGDAGDVLLSLVHLASFSAWAFAPCLLLVGLGLGGMLTPSVNLVQSAFPEESRGDLGAVGPHLNLGSSFGTAIAGTILVSNLASGNGTYIAAMIVLAALALLGLAIALFCQPILSRVRVSVRSRLRLRPPIRSIRRSDSSSFAQGTFAEAGGK